MPSIVHKYKVGTSVFCFEPDPSKAKLIYYAKIKQVCGFSTNGRSREPQYFVHFLGWKNKWDRKVPEDLLMDINYFTKMLKQKIDELATNIKDKEIRKKRIDTVLMNAAQAQDDVDWDSLPGTWQKDEKPIKSRTSNASSAGESHHRPQDLSESIEEKDVDAETSARMKFEALDAHLNFAPAIKLPKTLRALLSRHYISLARSASSIPCWCSALYLLQTYLNGFPYLNDTLNNSMTNNRNNADLFPSTIFRDRFSRSVASGYAKTDKSKLLCAEFCSSVRILFDALLEQYFFKTDEDRRHQNLAVTGPEIPVRGLYTILPKEEIAKDPSLPCLNYAAVYILRLLQNLRDLINQMPLSQCRRSVVLRHLYLFIAYLDRTRDFWFTSTQPDTPAPVNPISATASTANAVSAKSAFENVVNSVMTVAPSSPAQTSTPVVSVATSTVNKRSRPSDVTNSPTVAPPPMKRQRKMSTAELTPKVEVNEKSTKEKSNEKSLKRKSSTAAHAVSANQPDRASSIKRHLRSQGGVPIPVTKIISSNNIGNANIHTTSNSSAAETPNSCDKKKTNATSSLYASVAASKSPRQSLPRRIEAHKSRSSKRHFTRSTIPRMSLRSSRI
ncbi:unnamed protein product [Hymenolepis diminuta]|uniref:Uncharacterized protein n=1 Tax=Hymenolepis diminuta TaxID=6216 RepID=A0A564YNU4_HYMDI|nr:unnamed protein product [Hymenolepis diminuta]